MSPPLVTTIEDGSQSGGGAGGPGDGGGADRPVKSSLLILFNERTGPTQVAEIIALKHSFVDTEVWETVDELDRPAFLLVVNCETATADQLFDLIGSRLPDYIQARRFPPSRMGEVRRSGTRVG